MNWDTHGKKAAGAASGRCFCSASQSPGFTFVFKGLFVCLFVYVNESSICMCACMTEKDQTPLQIAMSYHVVAGG